MRFHIFNYYAIKNGKVVDMFTKKPGTKCADVEAWIGSHPDCEIKTTMRSYNI